MATSPDAKQLSLDLPDKQATPTSPSGLEPLPMAETVTQRRYKQGVDREQPMLLPACVDDYVSEDHLVRAIHAYVGTLDMPTAGFSHATGGVSAGQPAYAPADLLSLYLYGYLNRVTSSRRLAQECTRNLEVIWLLNGLQPSYHTISTFRKDNASALKSVNRDFILLCRELELVGGQCIGIDGSFFRGNASAASVKTQKQLETECLTLERDIERYQQALDAQDETETSADYPSSVTPERLDALKQRAQQNAEQRKAIEASDQTQLSMTDPDARRLHKGHQTVTGYNVQTVVDDKHKLIVAHEVTHAGNDQGQLVPMVEQALEVLPEINEETSELAVLADAGYFTQADIAHCEALPVSVYVPIPDKNRVIKKQDRFTAKAFVYEADEDAYRCPGQQWLRPIGKPRLKNGQYRQRYQSRKNACASCDLADQCLSRRSQTRTLHRSEHTDAVERHQKRMQQSKGTMRQRAALCEHPFGTLKRWMGWDHFRTRGFQKVRGEMALWVHAYNFRRLLSLLGVSDFVAICQARVQA